MKTKNLQLKDFFGTSVWSYTRVSTKEQFMNNGSIETQVKRIKNFAKENGLNITDEFDGRSQQSLRSEQEMSDTFLTSAVFDYTYFDTIVFT